MRDLLDRVAIPRWNAHHDRAVAPNLALATQATVALEPWGFFHAVFLIFFRFGKLIHALFDVDMTRRTRTNRAAGVFDVDAVLHGNLKQRLTFATLQLPLCTFSAGKAFRVLQDESNGHRRRPVYLLRVSQVHDELRLILSLN